MVRGADVGPGGRIGGCDCSAVSIASKGHTAPAVARSSRARPFVGESMRLVREPDAGDLHVRFDERDVETELRRGYSGTARRKGRQQTNRTYCHRATSRLYRSRSVADPKSRRTPKCPLSGSAIGRMRPRAGTDPRRSSVDSPPYAGTVAALATQPVCSRRLLRKLVPFGLECVRTHPPTIGSVRLHRNPTAHPLGPSEAAWKCPIARAGPRKTNSVGQFRSGEYGEKKSLVRPMLRNDADRDRGAVHPNKGVRRRIRTDS